MRWWEQDGGYGVLLVRVGVLGALLVSAALAGCAGPLSSEGAQRVRRATTVGTAVRVAAFALWNERCETGGLPQATVATQPDHGALAVRQADIIGGSRLYSGTTNCRDRVVPGIEFWYTPIPGFRGTDTMLYQVDAGQGAIRFVATVDVH